MTTRSSASTSSSTSRRRRRAPTTARACSSTATRLRVRSLRRRAAGRVGRAGRVPRRDAVPVAAGAARRRATAAVAVVDGEEGERSVHGRSDQPGPQDAPTGSAPARLAARVPHASSCGTAPVTSGCACRTSRWRRSRARDAGVCEADYADIFEVRGTKAQCWAGAGAHRRRRRCGAGATKVSTRSRAPRASRSTRRPTSWRATRRRFTSSCRRSDSVTILSPSAARWRGARRPAPATTRVRGAAGGDRARASHCRVHASTRSNEQFNEWIARSVPTCDDDHRHAARAVPVRGRAVVQHAVRARRHHHGARVVVARARRRAGVLASWRPRRRPR